MTAGVPGLALPVGSGLAVGRNPTTANKGRKPAVNIAVDVFGPQGKGGANQRSERSRGPTARARRMWWAQFVSELT